MKILLSFLVSLSFIGGIFLQFQHVQAITTPELRADFCTYTSATTHIEVGNVNYDVASMGVAYNNEETYIAGSAWYNGKTKLFISKDVEFKVEESIGDAVIYSPGDDENYNFIDIATSESYIYVYYTVMEESGTMQHAILSYNINTGITTTRDISERTDPKIEAYYDDHLYILSSTGLTYINPLTGSTYYLGPLEGSKVLAVDAQESIALTFDPGAGTVYVYQGATEGTMGKIATIPSPDSTLKPYKGQVLQHSGENYYSIQYVNKETISELRKWTVYNDNINKVAERNFMQNEFSAFEASQDETGAVSIFTATDAKGRVRLYKFTPGETAIKYLGRSGTITNLPIQDQFRGDEAKIISYDGLIVRAFNLEEVTVFNCKINPSQPTKSIFDKMMYMIGIATSVQY